MSEQQLDDFHQAMRKMRGEVGWLIDMSRAFRAVGNEKMADDLLECAWRRLNDITKSGLRKEANDENG